MSVRLEQVSVHEGEVALVNDCTLTVAAGERFALLGPGGAGKGTLLRVIAGFFSLDHGRILLHGQDVTRVPAQSRGVGIVLKEPALFNRMTVAENVEFALGLRVPSAVDRRRQAAELLELTGLERLATVYPLRVSAAERYRLAISRALAHEPRLLLLEEPSAGLDSREATLLHATLERARQRFGTTVILSTSDAEAAMRLADRIGVMAAGRVIETGDPTTLYLRPRTRLAARSLGRANLLLGSRERDGLRLGERVFPLAEWSSIGASAGDATVVVRPEDILLAAAAEDLPVPRTAIGIVERIEPAGSGQCIYVRCDGLGREADGEAVEGVATALVVTRTAVVARHAPLVRGQQVAVGFRRIHVLPTQLCSLWLMDASGRARSALKDSLMVRALSANMQVTPRPLHSALPGGDLPATALCVVADWGRRGIDAARELLERGAQQVLLVRDPSRPVRQMFMFGQPSRAARDRMLRIGASLLRYLPMEATMLVPGIRRPIRGGRYRMLLDLRRMALERHGIDLRTEILAGEALGGLAARLRQADGPVLLAFGLASPAAGRPLFDDLAGMLDSVPELGGVLLTCARAGARTPASLPMAEQRAVA